MPTDIWGLLAREDANTWRGLKPRNKRKIRGRKADANGNDSEGHPIFRAGPAPKRAKA